MFTRWMERVFDDQATVTRLVVLSVAGLGDLSLLHRPRGLADWVLALGALAVCLAGARLPLTATATVSALLVVGDGIGTGVGVPLKVMVAVTLFELALRGRGLRVAYGAGVSAFFLTLHAMSAPTAEVLPTLYRLAVLEGVPLLLGSYVRLIRERAAAEAGRRRADTLAARASERTAIARELHDLVAHHVSSMVLRVGVARHVLPAADPRVRQVLDDLHASGSAALVDLRWLVTVLRDPAQVGGGPFFSLVDRDGLPGALEEAADRVRATGLSVVAEIDPRVVELDAVRGLTVLRLAQEGLANAAKHAGEGAHVRMAVRVEEVIRLEITDDGGRGGAEASRQGGGRLPGHGLVGMGERVELLGGRFEAGPPPSGRGWRLYAELPPGTPSPAEAGPEAAFADAGQRVVSADAGQGAASADPGRGAALADDGPGAVAGRRSAGTTGRPVRVA